MGVRARIGKGLEATLGKERTDRVRKAERRTRQHLAGKLAPPSDDRHGGLAAAMCEAGSGRQRSAWVSLTTARVAGFQPTVRAHPEPNDDPHDCAQPERGLTTRPYLERSQRGGGSPSRGKSFGVDPEFRVRHPLRCDLDLVKAKSDESHPADALAHFDGCP